MNKFLKILTVVSAALLIGFDIFTIYKAFGYDNAGDRVNLILENMVPCGIVLGTVTFLNISNSPAKKYFNTFSAVVFSLMFFIRITGIIAQIIYIATGRGIIDINEYLFITMFTGLSALTVAAVFLAIYLNKNKFKNTTKGIIIAADIIIYVSFVVYIVIGARQYTFGTNSVWDFIKDRFTFSTVSYIVYAALYTFVFGHFLEAWKESSPKSLKANN